MTEFLKLNAYVKSHGGKKLVLSYALIGALCGVIALPVGFFAGRSHGYRIAVAELSATRANAHSSAPVPASGAVPSPIPIKPQPLNSEASKPAVGSKEELQASIARMIEDGGLILPSRMFVVAGDISLIYLRAIVPVEDPEVFEYAITCTCDFAVLQRRRVLLTPDTKVRGQFSLLVEVRTPAGDLVDRRSLEVSVVDPQAGSGQSFQMLMVGDSLGHANHFPDELANLLRRPGNPDVTFVGSFRPPGSTIPHEQYGGWTFWHFNELFNADPQNFQKDRSPFVFPGEGGKPVFDAQRYFDETLGGARPRNIHIQLGINDAFGLLPNDPGLAEKLDAILRQADLLIAGLHKPLPDAIITVGSVIQANATERAFVESYQKAGEELRSEWRWRQVQMRLARKMVEHFEGREAERIYLVPTHMAVDPIESYKPHPYMVAAFDFKIGNAVHPNSTGDAQLASAIFAVLKAELASAAIH
jgi:hypothetical protein